MAEITDLHDIAMGNTGSNSNIQGMRINTNFAITLKKIIKHANCTATKAYLLDASKSILTSASFTGDDATFNYSLTDATTYYVATDNDGSSYTQTYSNIVNPYPVADTNVDWTGALDNGTDNSQRSITVTGVTTEVAVGTNTQLNIGDVWKDVDSMQINIGDVWKDVIEIQQNIGDAWKTVF